MADETHASPLARLLSRLIYRCTTFLQPVAPLVTRLVVGEAFILTGLGKWKDLDGVTALFNRNGIPAPRANAVFIATLELVGGVCLMLGFGTRAFSLLLSATMVVALMTADRQDFLGAFDPNAEKGFTDVTSVVFLIPLLWLAAWGAGSISLDRILHHGSPDRV
jgi:putative oxidoreductase